MAKIYISIDAEGLPGIFHVVQLTPKAVLFEELKKISTRVAITVAEELYRLGFEEIWIADSHGYMCNIDFLELPRYVYLIRGWPRPISMVSYIDRGFDAAMFIGYHSAAGTPHSVLEHTYSGSAFYEIRINGERASEFYINALVAGHFNVPVILVSGDDKLREDVLGKAPWIEYIVTKTSISRFAAIMKSLDSFLEELREGIKRAIDKLRRGEAKPLKISYPIIVDFVMRKSEYADAGENVPGIERVDAYTLRYKAKDILEAYRVMTLLTYVATAIDTYTNALR